MNKKLNTNMLRYKPKGRAKINHRYSHVGTFVHYADRYLSTK